nr:unnamed protein product [Callosobruchus analis]
MCRCEFEEIYPVVIRMRHISITRRSSIAAHRKIPLNSIILPPLSPTLPEHEPQLIGKVLPLESYTSERVLRIKQEEAYSELREIKAGIPQGSVLVPLLYLLYASDIPDLEHNIIATFADDTAVLVVGNSHEEAAAKLQSTIDQIRTWTRRWRINLNERKSLYINELLEIIINPIYSFAGDSTLVSCMEQGKPLPFQDIARRRHNHASQVNADIKKLLNGAH